MENKKYDGKKRLKKSTMERKSKKNGKKTGKKKRKKIPAEADSYANPVERIRFWSDRQKQISFVRIETPFLCEIGSVDGARVIHLFACVIHKYRWYLDSEI